MEFKSEESIDLEVVRKLVDMEDILDYYGVRSNFSEKNGVLFGTSPLNGNGAREREPLFKVGLSSRRWYMYGPDSRGGNTLEFVAEKESVDLWEAADRILDWFDYRQKYIDVKVSAEEEYVTSNGTTEFIPELDPSHESIRQLGFREGTMNQFDAGYCHEGILEGRLVIPLHGELGDLIGYAGRKTQEGSAPLYKFVSKSGEELDRDDVTTRVGLFNLHRALDSAEYNFSGTVSVVVDIFDVFRLYESGINNVVAMVAPNAKGKQVEELTFCTSLYDE